MEIAALVKEKVDYIQILLLVVILDSHMELVDLVICTLLITVYDFTLAIYVGDITEVQPKAVGSSIINKLTNCLALDALKISGKDYKMNLINFEIFIK